MLAHVTVVTVVSLVTLVVLNALLLAAWLMLHGHTEGGKRVNTRWRGPSGLQGARIDDPADARHTRKARDSDH